MELYPGGDFEKLIQQDQIVCIYISGKECGVCGAVKPKIEKLLEDFPQVRSWYADLDENPEIAGQYSVFSIPALLLFVQGRETVRYARYFSIDEVRSSIQRYYSLLELDSLR